MSAAAIALAPMHSPGDRSRLSVGGSTSCSAAGAGAGISTRQLEALEVKLLAMVSGHLRQADKLQGFAGRDVDARIDALEHRQVHLERRFSELSVTVQDVRAEAADNPPTQPSPQQQRRRNSEEEARGCVEAERLERRLGGATDITGGGGGSPSAVGAAAASAAGCVGGRAARQGTAEEAGRRGCGGGCGAAQDERGPGGNSCSETLMLAAVQELEVLLQAEVKGMHKRIAALQDTIDENALMPLKDFEQRLQEHDHKVQQLVNVCQDCSSRVEEHEFRLGVARTKLEVHDQKLSRLEAMRWQRSGDAPEQRERLGSGGSDRLNLGLSSGGCRDGGSLLGLGSLGGNCGSDAPDRERFGGGGLDRDRPGSGGGSGGSLLGLSKLGGSGSWLGDHGSAGGDRADRGSRLSSGDGSLLGGLGGGTAFSSLS